MLLIVLLVKSPFMMLAQPQTDGIGLNPLLQDLWMVIHPPIVFLGYAGLAVPFALAIESLLVKRYQSWIADALPWALLSWSALGAGIFIGGFWAYKVLGWGGYWAWDPVENSSLVPWLLAGALVHVLFLARLRPLTVKLAYFASIFSFVMVLYGTFLTRSGVLSDFSTHSFTDEGIGGVLAGLVVISLFAAFVLLIIRWPALPSGELYSNVKSREFMLACVGLVLTLLAGLVLIGMSTPLVTMAIGNPQNVSATFYNTTSLPLAAAIAVLLAVGPLYKPGSGCLAGQLWWMPVVGLLALAVFWWLEIRQPLALLTVAAAVVAIFANIVAMLGRGLLRPAAFTHVGAAVMLIGIIISSVGSQSVIVNLQQQQPERIFGHTISYLGIERLPDDSGFYQSFAVEGYAGVVQAFTKLNKHGEPAAHEPAIYRRLTADLYLAPITKNETASAQELILHKGEAMAQDGLDIKFIRFSMTGMGSNQARVKSVLEITKDGTMQEIIPELGYRNGRIVGDAVKVFDRYEVSLSAVNPGESIIHISWRDLAEDVTNGKIEIEASQKPFINLVWLGATMITVGGIWAGISRYK
jgi:cytochrome c-type biogenesis protein CcmF